MNINQDDPVAIALENFFTAFPAGPLGIEAVGLSECCGRILAANISADADSPPFSRALVEGYLFNVADAEAAGDTTPVTLVINGSIEPGATLGGSIPEGTCLEVRTGSFIPEGTYAVARHMDVERTNDKVNIKRPCTNGDNIEKMGCEIKKGEVILGCGTKLSLQDIMLLASQCVESVDVSRKPIVAIFSSGDEVSPLSEPLKPGYVWDVNSYTLSSQVQEYGGVPLFLGIMKDEFSTFQRVLRTGLARTDMAVISGGTAAGGRELIVDLISSLDEPGVVVNGVPMRSGKPLVMGVIGDKPVVCVAGYPPESIRGFELFGKPAIARLLGQSPDK